ncbi:hypothetical protein B0J11DRAFT_314168 [Dendryphion nanum]|uniref:Rhodopsin domain-containing protein n=1 Tax=Dendryphion nanum TaxID=256645 RepID=A0A9P9DR65_9PLEO|nr:hypothetical protein B0J11DRAFT_314168 [Dendryphion nanum]
MTSVLEPESGLWYSLCWLVVIVRLWSRRLHLGSWKALQLDDYLILLAMATDTVVMAVMHEIVLTSSNLIAPGEDVSQFSAQDIANRVKGSKMVLVVEQMQIVTIWLVKACLLLMYRRMTLLLPQHKVVIVTAVYVALGFVIMEILYLGVWCRPFSQYWAVPPNSIQCSAATNHLITNAVLNISSDLIIIAIPMPLLFKVKLPMKTKAVLLFIFMIGMFTIIAAALNKYYSFRNPFGLEWTIWYLRESYTAILCANLPLTYPLIQKLFRLKNWSSNSYGASNNQYGQRSNITGTISGMKSRHRNQKLPSHASSHMASIRKTESQEGINETRDREDNDVGPLRIYQNTEFTVETTSALEMGILEPPKNEININVSRKSGSSDESARSNKSPRRNGY